MAKTSSKWLFVLLAIIVLAKVNGQGGRGGREESEFPPRGGGHGGGGRGFPPEEYGGGGGRMDSRRFVLSDIKRVVATDAGGMRVVKGVGGKFRESPMHIGFITMEPNSMFIPQYLDSSLILFVDIGEARIGSIYNDELVEKDLKTGDIYRIQAGSAFYLVNNAEGQRLHIITSIDTAESTDWSPFQTFYIGGGTNPKSVLAGFVPQTLATAMNVSVDVIGELFSSRQKGPIVFLNPDSESKDEPSMWTRFLEQETYDRKTQMKKMVNVRRKNNEEGENPSPWSLMKVFNCIFGKNAINKDKSLDSYNIFNRKADFKNDYGWSIEVNGDDYDPLKLSDFAVYLVNLTAGSMMAPHINPSAIEYGVVLSGSGTIQIVYPNGTLAMNAEVNAGDVFWIPRYFAFCQVASRSSPFVFFGFSTSAHDNMPQFLVGKGSLPQIMMGKEFATAFDLPEDRMTEIIDAQRESTILPSATASPGGGSEEIPGDESSDKSKEGSDQSKKGGDQGGSSLLVDI